MQSLQPKVITHIAGITHLDSCSLGSLEKQRSGHEGERDGNENDRITYHAAFSHSAAVSACDKDKQWYKALELLEDMRQ